MQLYADRMQLDETEFGFTGPSHAAFISSRLDPQYPSLLLSGQVPPRKGRQANPPLCRARTRDSS